MSINRSIWFYCPDNDDETIPFYFLQVGQSRILVKCQRPYPAGQQGGLTGKMFSVYPRAVSSLWPLSRGKMFPRICRKYDITLTTTEFF